MLNQESYNTLVESVARLHEVLLTRAERAVLVRAQPDVSWAEFLEMVDHLKPEVTRLAILTPQVEALARLDRHCLAWPIESQ